MTDEKLIEWFRKIKNTCYDKVACSGCKLYCKEAERSDVSIGKGRCLISILCDELSEEPYNWNIKEIERIIIL